MFKNFLLFLALLVSNLLMGQEEAITPTISYSGAPKKYEIANISLTGIQNYDTNILINLSGLKVGQTITIPGDEISNAIKKYWDHGLFSNVVIEATKIEGRKIYLNIILAERPRLSELHYFGLKKSETEELNPKVAMMKGGQVTPYLITRATKYIKKFFVEKGYSNVEVNVVQRNDTSKVNYVFLDINVDKKTKVKVRNIQFQGNTVFSNFKLAWAMKKTNIKGKVYNFFRSKKFIEDLYRKDLVSVIEKYNALGYRDARIVSDSIIKNDNNTVDIKISIEEGKKYYFGKISWIGNSLYAEDFLNFNLRIRKGDLFDQKRLDKRLTGDDDAVSNLYMDNGYLFSNITPAEKKVYNDTIDLEMRVYEGSQATINNVVIRGNTVTNEQVVRREIRTKPGQLFSKSELIRTIRELAQLGHFDPEQITPDVQPNQEDGTVDIVYNLVEKSNNQLELSAGVGGGMFVGSLGLKFTNFSLSNFLHFSEWSPLPSGDGQTIALRAQTNGSYYQSYSASFSEPWMGGKRPNSFNCSVYYQIQTGTNGNYNPYAYSGSSNGVIPSQYIDPTKSMEVTGVSMGLGKRLSWPDDYFQIYGEVGFTNYSLRHWTGFFLQDGTSKTINFKVVWSRNSVDNPLYPRGGSNISLGVNFTPPFSMFNGKDYSSSTMTPQDRYKFIEFHKWNFKSTFFKALDRGEKLVAMARYDYGYLGYYNQNAISPFEKFNVGGDGMSGYNLYGSETVGLRGYANGSLTPYSAAGSSNGNVYNKLTLELRYPITLKPSATIYVLTFLEAGNCWQSFGESNAFDLKKSAGAGVRIFLPIFGLMGIDWGYGFDAPYYSGSQTPFAVSGSQFHFVIGQSF